MIRICGSLAKHNYKVVLVGRRYRGAPPLPEQPFIQARLFCRFTSGWLLYMEWNLKLFFFLLFKKMDLVCAVDLDTIVPCYLISTLKGIERVYDAHELFTEMKEVVSRPYIKKCWLAVERFAVPRFQYGYTVSQQIADEFYRRYGSRFEVIRNVPLNNDPFFPPVLQKKIILYQGAVNHARGLENLIPAMKQVNAELHLYGKGNFEQETKALIARHHLESKVKLHAAVPPQELKTITATAYIGINLVENTGLNQYYSLANKFFDYIQAGIPQVTMQYPGYESINKEYEVAVLIANTDEQNIVGACNRLLEDEYLYKRLADNCRQARKLYNWQEEEKKLVAFYQKIPD
ncbi:MAG: glycosyltransferase [Chitinophagaceae bacterium]|nr:glycosyltransferase [Chitinophagaceae bacterium]